MEINNKIKESINLAEDNNFDLLKLEENVVSSSGPETKKVDRNSLGIDTKELRRLSNEE